ncbi:hypothetical protein D0860_07312 [Hortaea werneckii]|uniref:Metallo-beta-lactamase domain-containing protein n=1 Tax=Hortaea werneckii TaxID=91943 RepID=A0A3M7GLY3_HORWE|nr:hypothetical protein D0860_07312 [Hortaea werneckii]
MVSSITVHPLPPLRKQQQQQQQLGGKTENTNTDEKQEKPVKPHHRPRGSGFQNPWPSFQPHSLSEAFHLRFGAHPEKNFVPVPQGPNGTRSDELVRIRQPDWGWDRKEKLRATWIGHASFLVEFPVVTNAAATDAGTTTTAAGGAAAGTGAEHQQRGIRVLCDPVFSERTSPVQWLGPKRYTPTPCALEELPEVDVVCISHNHYDHLDYATVRHIYSRQRGRVHFVAGLGNKEWFTRHVGCQEDEAQDAPAACPAFKEIGEALGPFDLALLPIGLMSPHQWMGSVHATPEQSLQIHKDVKSKLSIEILPGGGKLPQRKRACGVEEDPRERRSRLKILDQALLNTAE